MRRDIVEYVRKALCWSGMMCRDIVEHVRKALCWVAWCVEISWSM